MTSSCGDKLEGEGEAEIAATERQAEAAIIHLKAAIEAAENSNQAGENAVVTAARAIGARL